jgi:hypothetical protein
MLLGKYVTGGNVKIIRCTVESMQATNEAKALVVSDATSSKSDFPRPSHCSVARSLIRCGAPHLDPPYRAYLAPPACREQGSPAHPWSRLFHCGNAMAIVGVESGLSGSKAEVLVTSSLWQLRPSEVLGKIRMDR